MVVDSNFRFFNGGGESESSLRDFEGDTAAIPILTDLKVPNSTYRNMMRIEDIVFG